MALFAVNTGCRDREICRLRWEWKLPVPELNPSVFIIPGMVVKNKADRLVILNDNAKAVLEEVRGIHPAYVFTYNGKPYYRMSSIVTSTPVTAAVNKAQKKSCEIPAQPLQA